jgi:tryptophan 2,3-dioxygenase
LLEYNHRNITGTAALDIQPATVGLKYKFGSPDNYLQVKRIIMVQKTDIDEKSSQFINLLKDKLESSGQNLSCHLEGLYHSRYTTYWDYTQLPILLNLQNPRTKSPDETIFIVYHQITELYFKLILLEAEQVTGLANVESSFFLERVRRINRYVKNLIYSFEIMLDGLDKSQFLEFRTALAPASGFQSYQYRLIEICATDISNLVILSLRDDALAPVSTEALYKNIYWKMGATDNLTGQKDLSLVNFEKAYDDILLQKIKTINGRNLYASFSNIPLSDPILPLLREELRIMDELINVEWRLSHFRSAAKHLRVQQSDVKATGGTNWRTYLPPRFQKVMFFPSLWSAEEQEEWGKTYVEQLFQQV